jgi:excisionase family DNA binding protein
MMKKLPQDSEFEPRIGRSVSIDHAARMLQVSRRTIYNRINDGYLQTIRTIGGSQRVLVDSLPFADREASRSDSTGTGVREPRRRELSDL